MDDVVENDTNPSSPDEVVDPQDQKDLVFIIYLLSIFLWVFLIIIIAPRIHDIYGYLIVAIPLVAFMISMYGIADNSLLEEISIRATGSEFVSLLVFPFYNILIDHEYNAEAKSQLIKIIIIALVFNLLTCIDIWVAKKYRLVMTHLRSIFQVFFFALVIFAFYIYYSTGSFTRHKKFLKHMDLN